MVRLGGYSALPLMHTLASTATAAHVLSLASKLRFQAAVMGVAGGRRPGWSRGSSCMVERQAATSGAVRSGRSARKRPNDSNARESYGRGGGGVKMEDRGSVTTIWSTPPLMAFADPRAVYPGAKNLGII